MKRNAKRNAKMIVIRGVAALLLAAASMAGGAGASHLAAARAAIRGARTTGQADLRTVRFDSRDLGGITPVDILLPDGYATSARRYPVLYLLAGHTGSYNQWPTHSDVVTLARALPLIVVMPEGGRGWYADPASGTGPRSESYIVDELIPYVDSHYRTVAARAGRAVAGLSMGGLGAFDLAARHPDLFVAAASFSGYLDLTPLEAPAWRGAYPSLAVYGDPATYGWYWEGHNPVELASNLRGLTLYLASGNGQPGPFDGPHTRADPEEAYARGALLAMSAALRRAGIPATVEDYGPGVHGWPYYTRDLHHALPLIMGAFAHPPAPPAPWSYRTVARRFDVWGYRVARTGGASGWIGLDGVSSAGLTVAGTGSIAVTTPALYQPGASYAVAVDGARRTVTADPSGRLSLAAPLSGPASPGRLTITPAVPR